MHHAYHIQDVTDLEVHRSQGMTRWDKDGEATLVHHHRHGEACIGKPHEDIPTVEYEVVGRTYIPDLFGDKLMRVKEKDNGPVEV